jgi:hypothetical protein
MTTPEEQAAEVLGEVSAQIRGFLTDEGITHPSFLATALTHRLAPLFAEERRKGAEEAIWHYVDDDGTGHWQDKGHRMHTVDYCNVCEFINGDGAAEFGSGTFDVATFPINPQWEGDYYSWSTTPAPQARAGESEGGA